MRTAAPNEDSVVQDGASIALPPAPPITTRNTVIAAGLPVVVVASGTDTITAQNPLYKVATVDIPFIIIDTVLVNPVAVLTGPLSIPAATLVGPSFTVPAGGAKSFIYTSNTWYVLGE